MLNSENIKYIGCNDHETDLFEGQYIIPNGMAYNSYVILDEKVAVMDTMDKHCTSQWLENLQNALGGRNPDFLIVQHMEPDHSASIKTFLEKYPETTVVGSRQAFVMMDNFFGKGIVTKNLVVGDKDTLSLGKHNLTFVTAPMVHWPEVILTYESTEKVLFSADAFGKFGALDVEEEDWDCEARRYYFGIVGKFGDQVQALLGKAATLEINTICPLHGPILTENLSYYINKYNTWSSYEPETDGIFIAYTSVYGNTEKAVKALEEELVKQGCKRVVVADLAREDMAECVEDAFRHNKLVLATTTYNGEYFPFMKTFIESLVERKFQKRTIGLMENGSWAPVAARRMKEEFSSSKDIVFVEPVVSIKSAMNEKNCEEIKALASALLK